MVRENLCPVCGFGMEDPPRDYNICPSCGTEFGVHDLNSSIENLRMVWLKNGARWWSSVDPEPAHWNPYAQLARVWMGIGWDVSDQTKECELEWTAEVQVSTGSADPYVQSVDIAPSPAFS